MRKILGLVAGSLLSAGCATFLEMNVRAYVDPARPVVGFRSFQVVPLGQCQQNSLLEAQVLDMVKRRLIARGLTHSNSNPDALVAVTCFMGPFQEYVPPRTLYWPTTTTSSSRTTASGTVGGTWASGTGHTTTTTTRLEPRTVGGGTVTSYFRHISVLMATPVERVGKAEVELAWAGEVDSSGSTGDLLVVAPALLDQLLGEFPQRSGKSTSRRISWTRPTNPQ